MLAIANLQSNEEIGLCTKAIRENVGCSGQREEYSDAEVGQRATNLLCLSNRGRLQGGGRREVSSLGMKMHRGLCMERPASLVERRCSSTVAKGTSGGVTETQMPICQEIGISSCKQQSQLDLILLASRGIA